jgi:hypothetical protein
MSKSTTRIRGFIRGQIVDSKTGKVVSDTGIVENKICNYGLQALAAFAAHAAGSVYPSYAVLATQTDAMNITQTALSGTSNSFKAFDASGTSGSSASYSCSFAGANGAISVAAAALHTTNALGGMWAGQTFNASSMATNQNFNLTYTLAFASA